MFGENLSREVSIATHPFTFPGFLAPMLKLCGRTYQVKDQVAPFLTVVLNLCLLLSLCEATKINIKWVIKNGNIGSWYISNAAVGPSNLYLKIVDGFPKLCVLISVLF